jgi:hypothetical protein
MKEYIDKSALVAEIKKNLRFIPEHVTAFDEGEEHAYHKILSFLDTIEAKEVDLDNNGWIDCAKQMPPEEKQYSDTLQGHREWTESDIVLVWDSLYGCGIDSTRNGKWRREGKGGYTGQVIHGIIAWRPIPEFSEELLLKSQKGE